MEINGGMRVFYFTGLLFLCVHIQLKAQTYNLYFGSCQHQEKPLNLLKTVANLQPDAFIYLGDNIYADTYDSVKLQQKYQQLAANPDFQALQKSTTIYATWDDHDYGVNDVGKYYPLKEASKRIFLTFFKEPARSNRWKHEGIYTVNYLKYKRIRIQLIVLDTRTFRSDLRLFNATTDVKDSSFHYQLDYVPNATCDSSFLGEAQWAWLEKTLKKRADLRIVCSSTQLAHSYNGYESWNNFPCEKERFFNVLQQTKAKGVVVISGDVHYAELSKVTHPGNYPLYDLTSSGITQSWHFATPNTNRIAGPVMENQVGRIRIDARQKCLYLEIMDGTGAIRISERVAFDALRF
ncbi:MAG: hypothetical protein RLZZ301_620 [Bacteroidota bacterium]|jgi:alkaline phosphatase D